MKNIIIIALLTISLLGSGFIIKSQWSSIHDLETRIEEIQATRQAEQDHFMREVDRQERLKSLQYTLGKIDEESKNDTSDAGSVFGASRLQRLNQIR